MTGLTRGQLLARTAGGGAAFALTGGVFASEAAAGAEAIGPGDIPVVTLALAAELLGAEFYTQALAAKVFGGNETRYLKRALFERERALHRDSPRSSPTPARRRVRPPTSTSPSRPRRSRRGAARRQLGLQLETAFLGIYLGGVGIAAGCDTRSAFARIAASQAQHLSVFSRHRPRQSRSGCRSRFR